MPFYKGCTPWNKDGGDYRPESLAKMSVSQKAKFERMPTPNKGIPHTEATKRKISQVLTGRKVVFLDKEKRQEWLRRMSKLKKGKPAPPHVQKILAECNRKRMADPKYIEKMRLAQKAKPTSLEMQFIALCQKYNLPFRYVGDGEIWIARMNPDFINVNGKKQVIEVLGNYWHTKKGTHERIENYKKYGFECIAIWEDELKDEILIIDRLGVTNERL